MTVQLHYYGSVFDLNPEVPDLFWDEYLHDRIGEIGAGGPSGIFVTLAGNREALIPYALGERIVIVQPRGLAERSHAYRIYKGAMDGFKPREG